MELGINFTAWPEMLAWPYLILQGWLPYKDIAIAHNPLLLFDLIIFYKFFGIGIWQLKIYTWLLIAINVYLTYFVATRFWNRKIGFVSGILYLFLCFVYEGNGLWFDLALAPFALLLYLFVRQKRYLPAGIIFALGFLTKQTFIYFLIPVLLSKINFRKFLAGLFTVFLIFLAVLYLFNILNDFYFWAVKFGIFYLPGAQGQIMFPSLKLLIFSITPFIILFSSPQFLIWILAGAAGVYPRFELFHFQPALPFLAIAISCFIFSKSKILTKGLIIFFIFMFLFFGLKRQTGLNTRFYEADVVGVINEISKTGEKEIYTINYWDNIYALTKTSPVTKPFIPYIPWYLDYQNNKKLIIDNLKLKMPELIIIGKRDKVFPEIYDFVDQYYLCNIITASVESCYKNK